MIATISAVAEKKVQRSKRSCGKPLSSDRRDRSDSKSTRMYCVCSRFSRWLPTQKLRKQSDLVLFMEEVQKYDCLYNKFLKEYIETSTRKSTAGKQSERNSIKVLNMSSLSFPSSSTSKNTHNYKKTRLK